MKTRLATLTKKDFKKVVQNGKKIKSEHLIVKYILNNLGILRLGFLLSKKFSKKAVIRNKLKRRIKEIFRKEEFKKGIDVVIIPLPGLDISFWALKNKLQSIIKKINDT